MYIYNPYIPSIIYIKKILYIKQSRGSTAITHPSFCCHACHASRRMAKRRKIPIGNIHIDLTDLGTIARK